MLKWQAILMPSLAIRHVKWKMCNLVAHFILIWKWSLCFFFGVLIFKRWRNPWMHSFTVQQYDPPICLTDSVYSANKFISAIHIDCAIWLVLYQTRSLFLIEPVKEDNNNHNYALYGIKRRRKTQCRKTNQRRFVSIYHQIRMACLDAVTTYVEIHALRWSV